MNSISKIPKSYRIKYGMFHALDHFIGMDRGRNWTKSSRKKYYQNLYAALKERGKGQLIPIEKRKNLSLKEFQESYLKKGIPVVLEGAANEWGCVKKWSLNYFKDLHGSDEIVMADQYKVESPFEKMTLGDVIDNIKQGGSKYYRFYPLLKNHPEHILDFNYKWLRERRNPFSVFEAFQVFMGGDKSITPLHNASQSNLFTQVVGEKKWTLYHHANTPVIDPAPVKNIYRGAPYKKESGPFDPFHPNFDAPYSLFEYIDGFSVHLNPGDVLWNPPYYWHGVENIGESIGVGYRWLSPLFCYKVSFLYALLDTLVINPPVWKSFGLTLKDGNLLYLLETGQLKEYLNSSKSNHLNQ